MKVIVTKPNINQKQPLIQILLEFVIGCVKLETINRASKRKRKIDAANEVRDTETKDSNEFSRNKIETEITQQEMVL